MLTHTDELVGMRVGSCTLERLLGLGGVSAVYLARQERPRRQVAVKLLRATHAPDQDGWQRTLARFHREADAAAALDHANIVPIYAFGVEDTGAGEIAYIVMPYLADGSLGALLARRGPLDVPEALVYLEQAGAALDYAHQAGIVHRDVKPSNLLLHPDGRLLLADFGVARALRGALDANLSTSGMTVGTPEYMAPEQIRGETVGPAADVYALGIVAYTLLGGHTPFEAPALARVGASGDGGEQREMRALLERQMNEPPPPLRMQRAGVSPRLEEAIFWALAKDPSDRPPTAGVFVRAARDGSRSRVMNAFFSMTGGRADGLLASGFATSLPRFAAATIPPLAFARGPDHLGDFGDSGDFGATVPGPDTPTIHDLPLLGERPAPEWPSPARTRGPNKRPPFSPTKLLLIAAGVLLGCALMVGGVGAFAYLLQGVGPVAGPSSTATGTSQPTATLEPTATAMPSIILAASPTDVTLSCSVRKGSQATITLSNRGQDTAQWSASQDGPQIAVNPPAGTIGPGKRQTVTLSRSSFTARDSQGTLRFSADGAADSASATVSYTLQGCFRTSGDNGDGAQAFQPVGAHVIGNGGKHGRKRED